MTLRACKICIFHVKEPKETNGTCRRMPPQLVVVPQQDALGRTGIATVAMFPAVQPDAWCGEFSLLMGMNAQ